MSSDGEMGRDGEIKRRREGKGMDEIELRKEEEERKARNFRSDSCLFLICVHIAIYKKDIRTQKPMCNLSSSSSSSFFLPIRHKSTITIPDTTMPRLYQTKTVSKKKKKKREGMEGYSPSTPSSGGDLCSDLYEYPIVLRTRIQVPNQSQSQAPPPQKKEKKKNERECIHKD